VSEYLTLKEAAKLSGYHQDYLSQLIRSGKLAGRRIGKDWLTTKYALVKYLEQRQKIPASKTGLRLPLWRRYRGLTLVGTLLLAIAILYFAVSQSELVVQIIGQRYFNLGGESEVQKFVFTNQQEANKQEVIVTTYTVDDDGGVEISVSAND
jgi:excisionase family DNA binding protein